MKLSSINELEVDLLLEAILKRHGYDFGSYARASVNRRVALFQRQSGCDTVADMIPRALHDETFFEGLVRSFSITVTEMFRDPDVYRCLRQEVIPFLRTHPYFKVWHAGCATGEEVYSLAIVLKEEGLYPRATVYATDYNDDALDKAKEGVYALDKAKVFTKNYQNAAGTGSFSDYYHAQYGALKLDASLKENITFANHNLVTDGVFSETHLVVCRNVLIYFDKDLQDRVLRLFSDSLAPGGFLCLGSKESLMFSDVRDDFEDVNREHRIFRKKMGV